MAEESKTVKEFRDFGITGKLRTGFVTGILGLSLVANVYMFSTLQKKDNQMVEMQGEIYNKLIDHIDPQIGQIQTKVDSATRKVDTAAKSIIQLQNNAR